MRDIQVTNYGICGECKWHRFEEESSIEEWVCDNPKSEHFPFCAEYKDTCDEWSERGIE